MFRKISSPNFIHFKSYSVYPPTFIHPIFRPSDQAALPPESREKASFLPVRAARVTQTGSVFYDPLVAKLVSHVMREGRREHARGLVERTFTEIKRIQHSKLATTDSTSSTSSTTPPTIDLNPITILHRAVQNARPLLQTTPVKRGGHTYHVPVPIRERASLALALKWLVESGQEKEDDQRFWWKLAREVVAAAEGQGAVIKRKQDLHRVCEANRAYAHYRWG